VELSSFTAEIQKKNILIKWTTASEKNNYGFYIERKISVDWQSIHFIEGRGTSTKEQKYYFIDILNENIPSNFITYRLRQVDYDGSSSYSGEIEVELNPIPEKIQLNQNYPNPFNPSTKISWQLPVSGRQTLKVYDVLGNEVATLVNEYKPAGRYEVEFNADKLPSGVYFYQLRAGNFEDTKKMILLR